MKDMVCRSINDFLEGLMDPVKEQVNHLDKPDLDPSLSLWKDWKDVRLNVQRMQAGLWIWKLSRIVALWPLSRWPFWGTRTCMEFV
jgi:hypothetical protein